MTESRGQPHMSNRAMCIVLHDVAPATWSACDRLLAALRQISDAPVTLLAVPRYHGSAREGSFERWLVERAATGDEVALHGYTHRDDGVPRSTVDFLRRRFYTRAEGEFSDLDVAGATDRLRAGIDWLNELGLPPRGFVAPAWLLGREAWQALRAQAFDYTCTLRRIVLLPEHREVICQSQVYSHSSAWRRAASLLWNAGLARTQSAAPLVRLELHPADVDHPRLRRSWLALAERQLATREAHTLASMVDRIRREPAPSGR